MELWNGLIVFLGTRDIEKSHRFYNELLELELYKDQGLCRIYNVPGGGKIGFCSHIEVLNSPKSPIITLLTDDVDSIYKRLMENDVPVFGLPSKNERFDIYHFFARDPDGYTIEVQRFLG